MKILVTGSLGFIGGHLVARLVGDGHEVLSLDNHSRVGAEFNLEYLKSLGGSLEHFSLDLSGFGGLHELVRSSQPDAVFHLGAQVAVTKSLENPRQDFETNVLGTFNLLESIRTASPHTHLIFASTNKVYGAFESLNFDELATRFSPPNPNLGFDERTPLQFSTPYGCSKGSADQYVIDWAKSYGLQTTVFRQSCIYGERQLGVEDQGWLAWFAIAHLLKRPITVYGTGKQVRDLLHVSDLVDAYVLALREPEIFHGVFNIGGGSENSMSVLEAIDVLGGSLGDDINFEFGPERAGDQKYFVSDNTRLESLGWSARVPVKQGIDLMASWLTDNFETLRQFN